MAGYSLLDEAFNPLTNYKPCNSELFETFANPKENSGSNNSKRNPNSNLSGNNSNANLVANGNNVNSNLSSNNANVNANTNENANVNANTNENVSIDKLFEYSQSDNVPIKTMNNRANNKVNKKSNNKVNKKSNNKVNNSELSDIVSRLDYLISNSTIVNRERQESLVNNSNIHDIILFVIFGIFVILILESIYKLTVTILRNKVYRNSN